MAGIHRRIALPPPRAVRRISLDEAMRSRRSVREFGPGALTLGEIAELLWAAQGTSDSSGHRTVPSAGALYPLALYLLIGDVTGLDHGTYRYDADAHALRPIEKQDRRRAISEAALAQDWIGAAAAIILIAADLESLAARYGARAERYAQIETGHVAQNIALQAAALRLGTTDVGAFDDAAVRQVVGLPRAEEPMLILPLGRHPRAS